jgi:hypothetical protein
LIARDAIGVSRAVKVLVVLLYGKTPLAQPLAERLDHSFSLEGVLMENLPFVG